MPARFSWRLLANIPNATLTSLAALLGLANPNHEQEIENSMSTLHSALGMRVMDHHENQEQAQFNIETPRTTDQALQSRERMHPRVVFYSRPCNTIILIWQ